MTETFLVTLSPAQRQALLHALSVVMSPPVEMRGYVDLASGAEIAPAELFELVINAPTVREDPD